ncbi:MAG TPA: hypothetical protein VF341_11790, partial [Anaeromyxobacteraceae bacterium]
LIEKRFLGAGEGGVGGADEEGDDDRPHLTGRDRHASALEDLFDFDRSPSLTTPVGQAAPPAQDCTP